MSEAHIRIDEGLKRGPRKPRTASPATATASEKPKRTGKLDNVEIKEILSRYLSDERTSDIAASYGVSRPLLNMRLLNECPEDWKQVQVLRAISRKEDAEEQLQGAQDALALARAREGLRSAQWELERVFSRIYGQKQEVAITMDVHVQVEHALTAEAGELLGRIRGAALPHKPQVIDVTGDATQQGKKIEP